MIVIRKENTGCANGQPEVGHNSPEKTNPVTRGMKQVVVVVAHLGRLSGKWRFYQNYCNCSVQSFLEI